MKLQKLDAGLFFSLFFVLCFTYGVVDALSYDFLARIFPLYVSGFLLIVALIALFMDLRRILGGKTVSVSKEADSSIVWMRFAKYLGIIIAIYLGIWILGYPLAMSLSILLFYRYETRVGWLLSFIAGAAGFGFLLIASSLLQMDWPEGLITLPWLMR
ncbi:hypothetical protein [Thermodesulforhabdus norvegica]|uniref:Tripartite tricarboxylate transporter TctB family protein n=1 Tax=Thermodesulforhabdus norvegica TaxID=39841 RepID=A0A1I4QF99_9BACT|nr:hypothetical protein [Thermodesulforhabdus norvegica]SFM38697.1 hypothetical protein SAMN05660836_00004 [Thermodesulforhabdus norvegica]